MARTINFFDGASSATTPTIGNVTASNLVQHANDAAYEAAEVGAPTTGNLYYNTTDDTIRYYDGTQWRVIAKNADVVANADDIADIRTTTGTSDGDTDMGAYTGTVLTDGTTTKANIQELGTQVDTNVTGISDNSADIADIRTTTGTSDGDTNMGTYTGSTITDNESTKENIQELETALEGIPSGLTFQGTWNADTNTPTLVSSTGTSGEYFIVSVAGSTNLDGESDWGVGDWAVFTDTGVWQKIDNSDTVTSVNSQTGTVVLDTDDIAEGSTNLYYTDVRADARIAAAVIDDLSDVDTTTSAPIATEVLTWSGSVWEPAPTPLDGSSWSPVDKTAAYTALANEFVNADAASVGAFTVTLPAAASNTGVRIAVKKTDSGANAVTVDGNASETIDGSLTLVLRSENEALYIVSDGTNWQIISHYFQEDLIESGATNQAYVITAGQAGDLTSISVTPGTWDIQGAVVYKGNSSATATSALGVSTTAGNSFSGLTEGDTQANLDIPASSNGSLFVLKRNVVLTSTTTYYLKGFQNAHSGSPLASYKIVAVRKTK